MQTHNLVQVQGRLGADIQIIKFDNGMKGVLSVATQKGFGEKQKTHWHTVILYNKAAHIASKLVKGNTVFCQGELEYRQWRDSNDNQRMTAEIISDKLIIIVGEVCSLADYPFENSKKSINSGPELGGSYAKKPPEQPKAEILNPDDSSVIVPPY
ncbi:hypothetical protein AMD27_16710 (plasmid) [Acinetobacter sp. TGL-Y2]|uniref:single-stranded DNA-binding protein n=1 Tax=Acinetobacter sp. TGL-Y2 TaxID=1407071 RepID=UPI0007A67A92|nr:single-stranded DNA-binding protein [Acinetobacter sp. TGL-Y2]AMW80558.1 hypothetical protein AMD27_16710 [Acinetobacter sp. TGL-Y2]